MKKKGRNKKSKASEFFRYVRGEMTKREEHAFQRELQKDPFAEEAIEGFSEISPAQAAKDIQKLDNQLKIRVTRKKRMVYYRIAASVAVLMVISSIFIIIERNKPSAQLSEVNISLQTTKASERKAIPEPEAQAPGGIAALPEPETDKKGVSGAMNESPMETTRVEKEKSASPSKSELTAGTGDQVIMDTTNKSEISVKDKPAGNLVADMAEMESKEFFEKGDTNKLAKADSSRLAMRKAIAGVPAMAMNTKETVPVAVARDDNTIEGYSPPQPVAGKENFDKYIEENMRKPDALAAGENAVVVIRFKVMNSGVIDSIKVIQSPGNEYSDESIRLIKEGPAWKPATSGGKNIDDEVRMRIVFK
jgi:TonB family protein